MSESDNRQEDSGQAIPQAGRLGRWIDKAGIVPAIGIVIAAGILLNEVVLRYVLNAPTIWAHETSIFLCGVAFVYGGLYCAARDRHIRVVLLYDVLPSHWRRRFDVAISVVCAIAAAFFTWATWLMVERAAFRPDGTFRLETSGSAWDPVFPGVMKIFLMATMAAITLQFLVLAWNHARGRK